MQKANFDIELVKNVYLSGKLKSVVNEQQLVEVLSDKVRAVFGDLASLEHDLSFLIVLCQCVGAVVKSKHKIDKKSVVLKIMVSFFPAMTEVDIIGKSTTIDTIVELGLVHGVPRLTKLYYKMFGKKKA